MSNIEVIVLCGSAGSIESINKILSSLPKGFKIPIIIVVHKKEEYLSENKLFKAFEVINPYDNEKIQEGHIYLAPSMYHLQVERDFTFSFAIDEKVIFSRPSIDVFLTTASYAYKKHISAIIFSGSSRDGTEGCKEIAKNGGSVIVQNPKETKFSIMPQSVIDNVNEVDILSLQQIIEYINRLGSVS